MPRQPACKDGTSGGTRLHKADREAACGFQRGEASARHHEIKRGLEVHPAKSVLETLEIARHQGPHIGIGNGGGEALELAHLRRHFTRDANGHVIRQTLLQFGADRFFMGGMGIGVKKTDGDGADVFSSNCFGNCCERREIKRNQDIAIDGHALLHRKAQVAGHQGRGAVDVEIIVIEALLVALLDHIAEPFRGDEGGGGTFAFDQRIGGKRCAMDEDAHVFGLDACFGQQGSGTVQHRHFRRMGGGEHLAAPALPALFEHDVGEGAANVGGQFEGLSHGWRAQCRKAGGLTSVEPCASSSGQ